MERKLDSIFFSMMIWVVFGLMMHISSRITQSHVDKDVVDRLGRIEAKLDASAKDTEEGIDSLHLLHEQRGLNIYTIQDTIVRIYHYAQPHKGKIQGCPECFKQVASRKRDFTEPLDEKDVDSEKGYVPPEDSAP